MPDNKKAFVFALTAVLLWSTVASAFKISLRFLSPVELLFFATITSIVVLSVILLFKRKLHLLWGMDGRDWWLSAKLGFLNPFLYYLILLYAYDLLPAQKAQAINYTWAITLSLLSIPLLKQKITRLEMVAVCIGYAGVVIIGAGGGVSSITRGDIYGIFLALLSTVIWSLYWIYNTKDKRDPIVGLLANFICGLPFIIGYLIVDNGGFTVQTAELRGVGGAVYVGTFEMGVAFVCWLIAMKSTHDTVNIANMIFLSPIISLVLIHFIVGEDILPTTIFGLIFILGGLALQVKAGRGK